MSFIKSLTDCIILTHKATDIALNADITNAQLHLKKALSIYESLWEQEPELLESKKHEIANLHVQAGLTIGQKLTTKYKR